jgi:hypothetical protein
MKANRFNSDILKKAIIINIIKINMARKIHSHLAPELLKVENVPKANTAPSDKIINCMKLTENHKMENATQAKNHFFICCGNITFIK